MESSRFLWAVRSVTALSVAVTAAYFYPRLPDVVAIHWNISGNADAFASKDFATAFFPGIILAVSVLFAWLPTIDPKADKYAIFNHSWELVQAALLAFFAYVYFVTLYVPLHPEANIGPLIAFGMGLLFILIGNYLGKIRSNYFFGIRTPWTLADEDVWNKTQRLGGKTFVAAGFVSMLAAAFPAWTFYVFFTAIAGAVAAPTWYSYSLFKNKKRK